MVNLHEIERGIGIDLMRRPVLTATLNAWLLRLFADAFLQPDEDEDEDDVDALKKLPSEKQHAHVGASHSPLSEKLAASAIFAAAHIVRLVGYAETAAWVLIALVYKALRLPRVYGFEKLVLDVCVLLFRPSLHYVKKTVRFQCRKGQKVPQLTLRRLGYGTMVLTVVSAAESLTRDTRAMLQLVRFVNSGTVAFYTVDSVVMVGVNKRVESALCRLGSEPIALDLGWHKDVIEKTNFKLGVVFTRENVRAMESGIQSVGKRVVSVQLGATLSTDNLELVVNSMGQFAAVCEAYERGLRLFNGKRVSIYVVGLAISVALIIFYEGAGGLVKPSADVLTLAVGAFTLWMTVGKSAALGETEEETVYMPHLRDNILLAFHGLARIEAEVRNVCWVPEVHREQQAERVDGAPSVDGSISVLEAAVCLSIFEHYGHMLKWSGPRLALDCFDVVAGDVKGMAHVASVKRLRSIAALRLRDDAPLVRRLGAERAAAAV